ncbi:MAG: ice-binding family protein [bacterium]|nr:ice-binding family protein [bacterium]
MKARVRKFTALVLALLLVFIPLVVLTATFFTTPPQVFASHSRVDLKTANNFAVLAGSAVTGTNTNVVNGDVGLDPAAGSAITLLTCSEVNGKLYDNNAGYTGGGGGSTACLATNAGLLTTAKNDLTAAYVDAASRPTTSTVATNLGTQTLTDGTYDSTSGTFEITGGQTLTLNGQGNADAVFIFKMATTLVTGSSSVVSLINGAQACNVYWQVGTSATLGTTTTLVGNVMADQSITDNGGSTVQGRLLARIAAVTLNDTTLTVTTCGAGTAGGPTTTVAASSSSGGSGSCPAVNYTAPIIIESRRVDADSVFLSWGPYTGTNTFNIIYGTENGNWEFSTNVTGFSTTINGLPANQPIWVRIAARSDCTIGNYGEAKLVGGPKLPNAGIGPNRFSFKP